MRQVDPVPSRVSRLHARRSFARQRATPTLRPGTVTAGRTTRLHLVVLALIAASAVLRGVAWAAALPAWQGPDEQAHYAYVERLASGELPPLQSDRAHRLSAAVERSELAAALEPFRDRTLDRPFAAPQRSALPGEPPGLPTDGVGALGATNYPPAYYALGLAAYALPGLETARARLFALRTVSALLAGLLVVTTFLLVRELAGPGLGLAGAALVSLPPMVGQASGIANPDVLTAAATGGFAWALLRLRRAPTARACWVQALAWALLALLTKPPAPLAIGSLVAGLALVPLLARSRRAAALVVGACAAGGAALALLGLLGGVERRANLSLASRYLVGFYLEPGREGPPRAWSVWVESGVGGFGLHSVWLPQWSYALAAAVVVAGAAAALAGLARDPERRHAHVLIGVAAAGALYVAGLHALEAAELIRGRPTVLQGRYLLPLAPVAVAVFLGGCATLPRRARVAAVGAVTAAWALLGLLGLAATVEYFAA